MTIRRHIATALSGLAAEPPPTTSDPELRRQLAAAINALGASETENAELRDRARDSEETVSRVTALYDRWVAAGPPPLGTSTSRWWDKRLAELRAAILPPADQTKEQ